MTTINKKEILDLLLQVWELKENKKKSLAGFVLVLYNTHRIFFLPTDQDLIEMLNSDIQKSEKKNITEKTN